MAVEEGGGSAELVTGGQNIQVNESNLYDYVRLYANYRLFKTQEKALEVRTYFLYKYSNFMSSLSDIKPDPHRICSILYILFLVKNYLTHVILFRQNTSFLEIRPERNFQNLISKRIKMSHFIALYGSKSIALCYVGPQQLPYRLQQ